MANFGDGFKNIFLAGIGAMAITGEKTKELVDQGKEINSELKHKAEDAFGTARENALEAFMATLTPEQRAEFAAKAAELAKKTDVEQAEQAEVGDASPVVTGEGDGSSAAPTSAADSQTTGA